MKRLFAAAAIILSLAALCWLHVSHLEGLVSGLIAQLEQVETCLTQEDWAGAENAVRSVSDQWEHQGFYLHTTLRHSEIDAIRSSMREILAFLDSREDVAECLAAKARLVNQLELLLEAELPTIKNLL